MLDDQSSQVILFLFVQIKGLDFVRMVHVPIQQKCRPENPQRSSNDEKLADSLDADTEDENRRKSEKQANRAFDRYAVH